MAISLPSPTDAARKVADLAMSVGSCANASSSSLRLDEAIRSSIDIMRYGPFGVVLRGASQSVGARDHRRNRHADLQRSRRAVQRTCARPPQAEGITEETSSALCRDHRGLVLTMVP